MQWYICEDNTRQVFGTLILWDPTLNEMDLQITQGAKW